MHALSTDLAAWGVPRARMYTEVFGSGESSMPGIANPHRPPHSPAGAVGTGPLVSFARSNLSIHWYSKYRSLLELAEACDVPVRWSCRTGVCHRCENPQTEKKSSPRQEVELGIRVIDRDTNTERIVYG